MPDSGTGACGLHASVPVYGRLAGLGTDGANAIESLDEVFRSLPADRPADRAHEPVSSDLVLPQIGDGLSNKLNTDWFWVNHQQSGVLDKITNLSAAEFGNDLEW